MPKLDSEKDVKRSKASFENSGNSKILKIPEDKKIPIYILNPNYEEGYVHYVRNGGQITRVVCAGGIDGKGMDTNNCLLCKEAMNLYKKAKILEGKGKKVAAKSVKKEASDLRASYSAEFVVALGEVIQIKDSKTGKYRKRADFDTEDSKVGIISMTEKQFNDFTDLCGSEEFSFIKSGKDLYNRAIILDKRKRDGGIYATVKFIPSEKSSPKPDLDYDEDELDISEDFSINEGAIQEAYDTITGKSEDMSDDDFDEDDFEEEDDDEDYDEEEDFAKKKSKKPLHSKKAPMDDIEEDEDTLDFVRKDLGKKKLKKGKK